jgi:hypothetical protein
MGLGGRKYHVPLIVTDTEMKGAHLKPFLNNQHSGRERRVGIIDTAEYSVIVPVQCWIRLKATSGHILT